MSGRRAARWLHAPIRHGCARPVLCEHQNLIDTTGRYSMSSEKIHKGSCFCGEVQFEVSGEPAGMGYCHCQSCRHWSAGPVNAFSLWNPQSLKVTHGAGSIGTYNKTPT